MNSRLATNLETTLQKAERSSSVAFCGALLFLALSLPKAPAAGHLLWTWMGFSVDFDPRIGLVVLYMVYVFSCLFTDNMLLHSRDLVLKLNDPVGAREILTYPTILTASIVGQVVITLVPGGLICLGVVMSYYNGGFPGVPGAVWWFVGSIGGLMGPLVCVRFWHSLCPIVPDLKEQVLGVRPKRTKRM